MKVIGIWAQIKNGVIGKDQVMPGIYQLNCDTLNKRQRATRSFGERVTYEGLKQTRPAKSDQYHSSLEMTYIWCREWKSFI